VNDLEFLFCGLVFQFIPGLASEARRFGTSWVKPLVSLCMIMIGVQRRYLSTCIHKLLMPNITSKYAELTLNFVNGARKNHGSQ
jgi:hypothetical protein